MVKRGRRWTALMLQKPPTAVDSNHQPPTPKPTTMALPLPTGLVPSEVSFLSEMELVTVVPRQRLEGIDLLSVSASQRVVPACNGTPSNTLDRARRRPSARRTVPTCLCGWRCS